MSQVDSLFNILEEGDVRIGRQIKKAYCLMGKTKAGKTTSCYYLSNLPLKGYKDDIDIKYKQQTNKYKKAIIGKTSNSQTQIPNFFPVVKQTGIQRDQSLIDFPGMGDSYGVSRIISNTYFNYQVFSRVQSMKFIIVISQIQLTKASSILETLNGFMNSFNNFSKIISSVLKSTVLLVTKISRQNDSIEGTIQKFIDGFAIEDQSQNLYNAKQILRDMVKNKKIFRFLSAVENQSAEKNNILTEIDLLTEFKWWERDYVNGKLNMNQVKYSIYNQIVKLTQQIPDQKHKFNTIINQMKRRYEIIIQNGIAGVLISVIKDALGLQSSHQFLKDIQQIQKDYYKYNDHIKEERDKLKSIVQIKIKNGETPNEVDLQKGKEIMNEKEDKKDSKVNNIYNCQYWIRKMRVADLINDFVINEEIQTNLNRSFQWIDEAECKLMRLLYELKTIAIFKKNIETIENYLYVIYRLFEEVKLFFLMLNNYNKSKEDEVQNIFQFFDFNTPLVDQVNRIIEQNFQIPKRAYALSYEIQRGLEPKKYFETLKFFNNLKQPKELPTNPKQNKIIRSKIIQLSVLSSQYELSHYENINIIESIRNINICRKELQKQLQISENEQFLSLMIDTITILAEFLLIQKNYDLAICCFNSINNAFRVIQIMQNLIVKQQSKSMKRQRLIELGKYASTHARKQLSIKCLQEAYNLSKGLKQYKEVSELLTIVSMSNEQENSKNYISRLIQDKFYEKLSPKINAKLQQLINP